MSLAAALPANAARISKPRKKKVSTQTLATIYEAFKKYPPASGSSVKTNAVIRKLSSKSRIK
jgi:hypothetical protein